MFFLNCNLCLFLLIAYLFLSIECKPIVHIIGHSHTDVGWLKTVDQYYTGVNKSIYGHVHQILSSVINGLLVNNRRRFSYGEQAFFQRYWSTLSNKEQDQIRSLVNNGQLEFINGGWVQHDEATTHAYDMIDQTTLGHQYILTQFGPQANPIAGWQIDPFGHSSTHVSLLTGEVGLLGLFFARIHYEDLQQRSDNLSLEWIWQSSPSLNNSVFAHVFAPINLPPTIGRGGYYGCPYKFCFNIKCYNNDVNRPIQNDSDIEDYNANDRINDAILFANELALHMRGDNQLWLMGDDFYWENANEMFKQLDLLIDLVNNNGSIHMMYSTPGTYIQAKLAENITLPIKTDDALNYASGPGSYWTGFYTSRPALKRYVRYSSAYLQLCRQWEVFAGQINPTNNSHLLWDALSIAQHHDAVAGTARQVVTDDYNKRLSMGLSLADAGLQYNIAMMVTPSNNQELPSFTSCPLTNISICPPSQSVNDNESTVIFIYNPLARKRSELIRIPVNDIGVSILDDNGQEITIELFPIPPSPALDPKRSAPYEIRWIATIEGLGFQTYFMINRGHKGRQQQQQEQEQEQAAYTDTDIDTIHTAEAGDDIDDSLLSISNEYWSISYDLNTGLLSQITNLLTGDVVPISQSFLWYGVDGSNAYSFLPNATYPYNMTSTSIPSLTRIVGPFSSEIQQTINEWVSCIIRLINGNEVISFDYTIGPVPVNIADTKSGKEVISRFTIPSIQNNQTFYTDSNGREWQERLLNHRSSFNMTITAPVSGNVFPITTGIYIQDIMNTDSTMMILSDRSCGSTSLNEGQIELFLHRRLTLPALYGEALNELDSNGLGLVITGQQKIIINNTDRGREEQSRFYSPYHISYAKISSYNDYIKTHILAGSFLLNELPINVDLISLHYNIDGSILLRLSHQYGIHESSIYSSPVEIDLQSLFTRQISNITEMSLTANRPINNNTIDNTYTDTNIHTDTRHSDSHIDIDRTDIDTNTDTDTDTDTSINHSRRYRYRSGLQNDDSTVIIKPMQIKTFRIIFK